MKIDKRIPGTPPGKVSGTATRATGGKAGPAGKAGAGDQLALTSTSAMVRSLEADLTGMDVTDTAKIESVKAAIADGSYRVDAEVVADRMIDEAKQNLRRRPRKK